jgi:hypothetical protein
MSKGSRPRPYSVPLKQFNDNFDTIFRKDKRLEEEAKQEDEEFERINNHQNKNRDNQSA